MHDDQRTGGAWALRVARDWRSARFARLAFGFSGGSADEGFFALDLMLDVVPLPRFVLTPVLALGGGVMAEPEWGGPFGQATAGVELRPHSRLRLRAARQWGTHDGRLGPNLTTFGLALYSGGRTRAP